MYLSNLEVRSLGPWHQTILRSIPTAVRWDVPSILIPYLRARRYFRCHQLIIITIKMIKASKLAALLCLLFGAELVSVFAKSNNNMSSLRRSGQHKTAAATEAAGTASETTKRNGVKMFASLLQLHSVQTFTLRPTSTLLFEADHGEDIDKNSTPHDERRQTLLKALLASDQSDHAAAAHGVYGTLRRLVDADMFIEDGRDISSLRQLMDRHNALLDQFNSERHLSRFERHVREMQRSGRRRKGRERRVLQEEKENADVNEAATAITEAAVETLYEGVLPVITEPAMQEDEGEEASLCSANARCEAQGLTGRCCPTIDGAYLACCSGDDAVAPMMSDPEILPPPPGSDVEAPVVTSKATAPAGGNDGTSTSPHEPETPIVDKRPVDPAMAEASAIIEDLFDGMNPDMVDIIEEEHGEEEAFKEMAEAAGIISVEEEETLAGGRLDSYQSSPLGQGYGTHCKLFVSPQIGHICILYIYIYV